VSNPLVPFVEALQITGSQVVADPETSEANHIIQDRLATRYQTSRFRFGEYAEKAGHLQAPARGNSPTALLIHQEQIRYQFAGDHYSFCFAGIELFTQTFNFALVMRCNNSCPQWYCLKSVPLEFLRDRRWDHNLDVQISQQVQFVYGGKVEDGRRVGNNNQALLIPFAL
jgi:hypothetical protein